ncbi:hypothetical protein [Rhizobium sp.]
MENTTATSGKTVWTLADFLSTYRYWALFLSSLLVALTEQGFSTVFPLVLRQIGGTNENIGVFFFGMTTGWIIGAFLAFVVASRSALPALVAPLVVCIIVAFAALLMPDLWGLTVFLFLFGLAFGALRGVLALAIAIFLVGGRAGRIDFGCALTLMSTTILFGFAAPLLWSLLYEAIGGTTGLVIGFLVCMGVAILMLVLAGKLDFDDQPRIRHQPLPVQRRSPVAVALILAAPTLLSIALFVVANILPQIDGRSETSQIISLLLALFSILLAIGVFIYLAWWAYHIHGELAGAAASPRLLTPLAGMLVAILVPLGLPILLMTLADLVNDRAREKGQAPLVSIAWLAIWSLVFPPIAIALIQDAANRSYDLPAHAA